MLNLVCLVFSQFTEYVTEVLKF